MKDISMSIIILIVSVIHVSADNIIFSATFGGSGGNQFDFSGQYGGK